MTDSMAARTIHAFALLAVRSILRHELGCCGKTLLYPHPASGPEPHSLNIYLRAPNHQDPTQSPVSQDRVNMLLKHI